MGSSSKKYLSQLDPTRPFREASATGGTSLIDPLGFFDPNSPFSLNGGSASGDGGINSITSKEYTREQGARTSTYNEAKDDRTIDPKSQEEIAALYNSGASSTTIQATIAAAREGKGVYGVRKIRNNQAQFLKDMPGRSQLVAMGNTIV